MTTGFVGAGVATAIAGIGLGSFINRLVSTDKLKTAFGWLTLILGIGLLLSQLSKLSLLGPHS